MTQEEKLALGKEAISLAFAEAIVTCVGRLETQAQVAGAIHRLLIQEGGFADTRLTIMQAIGRDSMLADSLDAIVSTARSMGHGWRDYLSHGEGMMSREMWPYRELCCDVELESKRLRQLWREQGGGLRGRTRMVAHHQDEIWRRVNRFFLPFAPLDFVGDARHYTRNLSQHEATELRLPQTELVALPSVNFNRLFVVLKRELPLFVEETARALAEAEEECAGVERKPAWTWNPLLEEFYQLIKRLMAGGALDTAGFLELVEWLRRCPDMTRYPIKQVGQEVEKTIADGKATSKEQDRVERLLLKALRG